MKHLLMYKSNVIFLLKNERQQLHNLSTLPSATTAGTHGIDTHPQL